MSRLFNLSEREIISIFFSCHAAVFFPRGEEYKVRGISMSRNPRRYMKAAWRG
jgi:hypothetical protein